MNRLSTIVRHLCKYQGVKMNVIAKNMGISPATLSKNLSNDNPREESLNRYADAFGVPHDVFKEYYHNPKGFEVSSVDGKIVLTPVDSNYTLHRLNDRMIEINDDSEGVLLKPHYEEVAYPKGKSLRSFKPKGMDVIDEETGEVIIVPDDTISAMFNYKGTKLYANSVQTIKDVANMISSLATMENKELHDASLALLVDRYGVK